MMYQRDFSGYYTFSTNPNTMELIEENDLGVFTTEIFRSSRQYAATAQAFFCLGPDQKTFSETGYPQLQAIVLHLHPTASRLLHPVLESLPDQDVTSNVWRVYSAEQFNSSQASIRNHMRID